MLARRDTREKIPTPMDGLTGRVKDLLDAIQQNLFDRALAFQRDHTTQTSSYDEFKQIMDGRPGFVVSPWCGTDLCEAEIKTETQATIRNLPMEGGPTSATCIKCGKPAVADAWFAKSY
jgi:prolyl-tRNA synthetase